MSATAADGETLKLLPEGKKSISNGTASQLHLTLNLFVAGLGTGIFSLPWSTAGASVVPAVSIIAAVLLLNVWTFSIIIEAGEYHQTFDLGGLLARLPGRLGSIAQLSCNTFVWMSTYLALVGYIIVIADCIQATMPASILPKRAFLVVVATAIVLPICFFDQRQLSMTSSMAVIAVLTIFATIVALFVSEETGNSLPPTCYMGLSTGSIAMCSAMMQVVVIQSCILPMYKELKDRTPEKFNRVVTVSFTGLLLLCSGFSVLGYLVFGKDVSSNVLLNLPQTFWGNISRICAAASVVAVYPMMMNPMIAPLRNMDPLKLAMLTGRSHQQVLLAATCGVAFAASFAALFLHDLGFVNVVNGALGCGVFVALVPSFVGLYLLPWSNKRLWQLAMYTLCTGGLIMSAVGVVLTDNYSALLHDHCTWRNHA